MTQLFLELFDQVLLRINTRNNTAEAVMKGLSFFFFCLHIKLQPQNHKINML